MSVMLAQAVTDATGNDAALWWGIVLFAAALVLLAVELLVPSGQEAKALSEAVRSLAATRLAIALRVDAGAIEIREQDRLPELFVGGVRAPADLSLSHHGEIVGFACEIFEARRASVAGRSLAQESTL